MRGFISKFYPVQIFPKVPHKTNYRFYWDLALSTVKNLETPQGILASGKDEIYGAIFGRDSLITSLKLLKVYRKTKNPELLRIVKKVLITMVELQGRAVNIESGEEPGKIIHEYRPSNHEHLTRNPVSPWYLYPDKIMRNYDSVDSTPLFLITAYRYLKVSGDKAFLGRISSSIRLALKWISNFGDSNDDLFIDFGMNPGRKHGGLKNQNWMDSVESVFHEDKETVIYPVAPVEAQAYSYLALRLWGKYFAEHNQKVSRPLLKKAKALKRKFNKKFVLKDSDGIYLASGIDNEGKPLRSVRSSMGHCLWASLTKEEDGELDSIVKKEFVEQIVERLFKEDLYVKDVGVRTLSKKSRCFEFMSYHNGSIWPHDNSIIAEGLENFGFLEKAAELRNSILAAVNYFKTPVELFAFDSSYKPYISESGQSACQNQAWSAAAILGSVNHPVHRKRKYLLESLFLSWVNKGFLENFVSRVAALPRVEITSLLSVRESLPFFEKNKR